ncbi:hypothetical protein N8I71_02990 [Roseibacterium sp. SDUM158016]|jgi:hypothetical protein|uniref:hypothetical protein n=1 Tax=Roseicyclus sediminis TaxID=2980997 RepID=UPI0021CFC6B0|nr:hypothetical protein [Roseibacterium sp. SDUM158016]MCU4651778.1 hypothetical protein [Roseibacterium sp. SDUM158016]
MKRLASAAAISLALVAGTAHAGGMVEPAMTPAVIIEDTAASSGGILVPILFLIFVAAVTHH